VTFSTIPQFCATCREQLGSQSLWLDGKAYHYGCSPVPLPIAQRTPEAIEPPVRHRRSATVVRWTSDDDDEEMHFFVRGDAGYYVAGFNPKLFTDAAVREFLRQHGIEWRAEGK